MDWIKLLKA